MGYGKSPSPDPRRRGGPPDRIRLVRDGASGVEAIHGRFAGHAYDLHRHDEWLVGVTSHGVQDFFCRGTRQRSTPGRVILIEPQEAHDGQAGSAEGFSYCMLYLPHTWLKSMIGGRCEDLGFPQGLIDDPQLARMIRHACAILGRPTDVSGAEGDRPVRSQPSVRLSDIQSHDRLSMDAALESVVHRLRPHLGRAVRQLSPRTTRSHADHVARRARAYLHDSMESEISTDALARAAGAVDRFQLARAFRAAYGTSPHAYLVQMRLLSARHRLALGEPPAEVAAACGFADQSHFGRWFRRAYGVTPAAYRACCTDVPDYAAGIG